MGRTLENKKAIVEGLKETLSESTLTLVINYQGLTVGEITDLRRRLRDKGATCTVTKNTLMNKAIAGDERWEPMSELLKTTTAFIMVKEDIGGAVKAYQEFQKAAKKTEVIGGVMDGKLLSDKDVKAIADLPSKEQLIAQIAGAINGVATKLAVGINEVPSGLARAIKQISEKEAA
ncbi:50S ribosomal protein L10 [Alkalinema sp. FACHB-956]|uniref:50S ribosomal protein L10 n=1 Tax=Alkalinema sp. FACHB-956 TaxID=2692768 RepID=UPI001689DD0B|nr:50S ribosomal protein L10 [Alkalinema sp. FACHB-956]MBD2326690.1 50S ribosomal protein L10 [Alkalinema sp. FACHB-956]